MKHIAGIGLVVLLAGLGAVAQDQANQEADSIDNHQKAELRTVEGCLSKTADTYVITGGAPGPKQFRIVGGDTSMLKKKIGQTVKVVGMVTHSTPTENVAPPYNEGSTTGVGYDKIVAQKIVVVGGLCSEPGKEWPGDHE